MGGRAVAADNIRHHQLIAAWSFAEPEHRDVELRDGGGWGGRAVLDRAEGAPRLADRVALLPSLGSTWWLDLASTWAGDLAGSVLEMLSRSCAHAETRSGIRHVLARKKSVHRPATPLAPLSRFFADTPEYAVLPSATRPSSEVSSIPFVEVVRSTGLRGGRRRRGRAVLGGREVRSQPSRSFWLACWRPVIRRAPDATRFPSI